MGLDRKYLGQAVKYPHQVNTLGRVELISGPNLVRQSILILLQTPQGADFDNPDRGSRLHLAQWEPNDTVLENLLDYYVYEVIERWEKRAIFLDTEISYISGKPDQVNVKVKYLIKATNTEDSLIFPYYRKIAA